MTFFQTLIRKGVYPLNLWFDGEWAEMLYMREYERTQFLPPDELASQRLGRLQQILDHAYRQCPYYRSKWDDLGIVPTDVKELSDLARFPILTKQNIQQHRDDMVANNWPRNDLKTNQTGGSTGTPISFFQSNDRVFSGNAATWRHNRWAGYDIGDKAALVWGAPRDFPGSSLKHYLRNLLLDRILYLDTAHITEEKIRSFHDSLKRFRPKIILAYARSLSFVARYLKENGLQPYQPWSIITSAEVLAPEHRSLIEEVFGCPVYDRYGSREVGVLASECSEHTGLHIMAEGLYIEIVSGDSLADPGEIGKVVVTDLRNKAMPLIRYEIGDMASFASETCSCGRSLPRLKNIAGRVTDFVVGTDGRLVSGVFLATYVIAMRPSLGQVQIRQDTPGRLLYRIVRQGRKDVSLADVDFLRNASLKYLGDETQVEFEFVDELKPESSGKFLFCRSTVNSGFLGM